MRKLKILWHTEASYVGSGFGVYAREILKRLKATNKYELAEFANYGTVNNRQDDSEWQFYANAVDASDQRQQIYSSDPLNVFGKWRFERVLIDFKPDVQVSFLDPWMMNYQEQSPLRRYFHRVIMPTCDSAPQQNEWIYIFNQADGVLTYEDWALNVFSEQSGGRMKLFKSAPPGIDTSIFNTVPNIKQHRASIGIQPDIFLVGTVMRNQLRKLYPDLFRAFRRFLDICEEKNRHDIAQKSFLLCHTSFPDMGWYLPQFIKETGLANKILFTYFCKNCNNIAFKYFQDARSVCTRCNTVSSMFPNTGAGIPHDELAKLYQAMDVYIQYAICEGMGMPQVEATSCGTPLMATDYSAMSDVVRKTGGVPIPVQKFYTELETHAFRAYPDNEYLANQLYLFFSKPEGIRKRMGMQAREGTQQHYTWDATAKIWEEYFDNVTLKGLQGKWDAPFTSVTPDTSIPKDLINNIPAYAQWLITNVLCEPDLLNSYLHLHLVQQLNYGAQVGIKSVAPSIQKIYLLILPIE